MPAHAPRPSHAIGDREPLLYEFSYESSSDVQIDELRRQRAILTTRTIVNVLLDGGLTQPPCGEYSCDRLAAPSDTFSPVDGLGNLPGEDRVHPGSFFRRLAAHEGLSADDRERFLGASYWFDHAGSARSGSYSAALIALVTAIECLMPRPEGRVFCRECKHEKGDAPTKRFMAFVTSHVTDSNSAERYVKDLYRTRSTLAHGWQLHLRDRDAAMWPLHPASSEERFRADGAMALVRGILLGWLTERQPHAGP